MMNETCLYCEEGISDDSVVYCYKCGKPHHESCFLNLKKCGTLKCKSAIYVSNSGSGTVDCAKLKSDGELNLPAAKGITNLASKGDSSNNPWLMVFCLLLSFSVILGVTVLLARFSG